MCLHCGYGAGFCCVLNNIISQYPLFSLCKHVSNITPLKTHQMQSAKKWGPRSLGSELSLVLSEEKGGKMAPAGSKQVFQSRAKSDIGTVF